LRGVTQERESVASALAVQERGEAGSIKAYSREGGTESQEKCKEGEGP